MSARPRPSWLAPILAALTTALIAVSACGFEPSAPAVVVSPPPTATAQEMTPVATLTAPSRPGASLPPTATPGPPDSGWLPVASGMEWRMIRLFGADGQLQEAITLVRVEPDQHSFEVLYSPGSPRTVQEWAADTDAAIVLNAGYFTPEYLAAGLIVADGVHYGQSYRDFAGMLAVGQDGVRVRWLRDQPYSPDEPLTAAVQSFPLLIKPGGTLGFPQEDGFPARRTVIAQDRAGRIVIVVCPGGTLTLYRLALLLMQSDLDLDIALNLDGGTSSGLVLSAGQESIAIPSYTAVPAVITIRGN